MAMRDGHNPDQRTTNYIRNVVREYFQVDPLITAKSDAGHAVISRDPGNVLVNFIPKSLT